MLKQLHDSYTQLESKVIENNTRQAKFTELNELQKEFTNMDETIKNIHSFFSNDTSNSTDVDCQDLNENKQNKLHEIKSTLDNLNEQLKNANDSLNNHLNLSEVDMNNDSTRILKQLQETVKNLTEKCSLLNSMQQKEEEFLREQSNLLELLQNQIQQCNIEITKCTDDFKSKFFSVDDNNSTQSLGTLLGELNFIFGLLSFSIWALI